MLAKEIIPGKQYTDYKHKSKIINRPRRGISSSMYKEDQSVYTDKDFEEENDGLEDQKENSSNSRGINFNNFNPDNESKSILSSSKIEEEDMDETMQHNEVQPTNTTFDPFINSDIAAQIANQDSEIFSGTIQTSKDNGEGNGVLENSVLQVDE